MKARILSEILDNGNYSNFKSIIIVYGDRKNRKNLYNEIKKQDDQKEKKQKDTKVSKIPVRWLRKSENIGNEKSFRKMNEANILVVKRLWNFKGLNPSQLKSIVSGEAFQLMKTLNDCIYIENISPKKLVIFAGTRKPNIPDMDVGVLARMNIIQV